MSPSSAGKGRSPRRLRDESEEESFGELPDDELLALISGGGFSAEDSCEAVEEALRRGLECPDAIPLMRDLLYGFETPLLRYRACVSLARMKEWDDDIHRGLCLAVSKLPGDVPLARSARLQLQKQGHSPADPPLRPTVGATVNHPAPIPAKPNTPVSAPAKIAEATPQAQPSATAQSSPAAERPPQSMTVLPRYTTEDLEEPRLRYRRRKRKRGELLRQVISNVQMLLIFIIACILFLVILAQF